MLTRAELRRLARARLCRGPVFPEALRRSRLSLRLCRGDCPEGTDLPDPALGRVSGDDRGVQPVGCAQLSDPRPDRPPAPLRGRDPDSTAVPGGLVCRRTMEE